MPGEDGWRSGQLSEVADIQAGINKPKSFMGRGILYVTVQDLYNGTSIPVAQLGRIDVTPQEAEHRLLCPGDIIFGKSSVKREGIGYPSRFHGADEPVVCSGFTYRLRARPTVADAGFLFQTLRWQRTRDWLIDNAQASALTNINAGIADRIPVPVPPLAEQRKIAAILASVDEAILATQSVIDQTRRVKEGLLQDLLTRGFGHTRFKQTEIGEIPESWDVRRMDSLAVVVAGGTPSRDRSDYYGGGIPWVKSGEVNNHRIYSTEESLTASGVENSAAQVIPAGSTLVAMYGATAGVVAKLEIDAATNQAVAALMPGADIVGEWLFHVTQAGAAGLLKKVQGSGQPNLNGRMVKDMLIPTPPAQEQTEIANVFIGIDCVLERASASARVLSNLKAGLLQDLLTGHVRVAA